MNHIRRPACQRKGRKRAEKGRKGKGLEFADRGSNGKGEEPADQRGLINWGDCDESLRAQIDGVLPLPS